MWCSTYFIIILIDVKTVVQLNICEETMLFVNFTSNFWVKIVTMSNFLKLKKKVYKKNLTKKQKTSEYNIQFLLHLITLFSNYNF